ncbi:MAG: carbohydrate kinase [Bacteroidales bacterium]|jgi:xylulokinase|nr:FGGY family carbohydrate kinase [Bacteroidota bacterium]NLN99145.1 carbohydrate kinase [Bacteroidales bacterium]
MYLLGYDIGSSSVKASLVEAETGNSIASAFNPKHEAPILALKPGWAEQEPEDWWSFLKASTREILSESRVDPKDIGAIGISYQMHGLVVVGKNLRPLRPSIIWCDSRAVPYGQKAFKQLGEKRSLEHLLNSPGNFTAAKLAWVKENEPEIYSEIYKFMLPGDYIALKLTGEICTTMGGLSEGIFWDFKENRVSDDLIRVMELDKSMFPEVRPTFSDQGRVSPAAAEELGLAPGIPVAYRAGDQPNNALSLNVFNPGEIAATAGTSGVVYGVNSEMNYDTRSRVNIFAHVNHTAENPRLGVLLCINGTGILNSWQRHQMLQDSLDYPEMNALAAEAPIGSEGLSVLPFGNGAERELENREIGAAFLGLDFNRHKLAHLLRASQEGIVFSFRYGMDIMRQMGMQVSKIHAGYANMFMSPIFRQTLAGVSGATIELLDTDGAAGAAKGAGMGIGYYKNNDEAFGTLKLRETIESVQADRERYEEAYRLWLSRLEAIAGTVPI